MKSRVQKNQALHEALSSNAESGIENSNLSQFANRLNQIDDQFRKMDENEPKVDHEPTRARQHIPTQSEPVEPNTFDTFENTYLKEFLNEVKEYNVKKGYRDEGNTQSNIFKELDIDAETIQKINPDIMQSVINEIDPSLKADANILEETRVFRVDSLQDEHSVPDLEKTISMAVHELAQDVDTPADTQVAKTQTQETEAEPAVEVSQDDYVDVAPIDEVVELDIDMLDDKYEENLDEVGSFNFDSEKFKRELLDQTQTLQHKIIDQERHIEEISDTMVKTNRMMNVVISLLVLAIFVVIILILIQKV